MPGKDPQHHHCRVFGSPWKGVYGTHIDSARHYGKHFHSTYGFGLLENGAQRSASGRGQVDAYAGDLITTNPGEVHDGRPLGGPSRRWRIVYLDPDVVASMTGDRASGAPLTRPVIRDARLRLALGRLLGRLDDWSSARRATGAEALACEESLVETCALLMDRHATATPARVAPASMSQVRSRLADDLLNPPTLAELGAVAGVSRYQVLRRFEKAYGMTPHAWLLQQRAESARASILGGASLAHAAASAGFADQSHMTRVFVCRFGFTPGAWRKAVAPQ